MPFVVDVGSAIPFQEIESCFLKKIFYACQFAECQSADFETLVRATMPTESMISTLRLTPLRRPLT